MDNTLFEQVDNYISDLLAPEDKILSAALKLLERENIPNISISPTQGKLLQVFAKACNARRILEIGTLGAYSTIWLARTLPDDGKLITIEYDENCAKVAAKNIANAGLSDKIDLRIGKALEVLTGMKNAGEQPFDLVFIDADKPPYLEYFKLALELSRQGSIIICDNVIREGKILDDATTDEKVIGVQRLNNYLSNSKEVTATILQTVGVKEHDGMVIAVVN